MESTPPASHILLVTSVMARIESALTELWAVPGPDLKQKIDMLRQHQVQGQVIGALHYLRIERNRVLHHPCRPLRDVERFRTLANEVLPIVERQPQSALPAIPLSDQLKGAVSDRLMNLTHSVSPADTTRQMLAQLVAESLNKLRATGTKQASSHLV